MLEITALFALLLSSGSTAQPAYMPPLPPWRLYVEARKNPDLGKPYEAFRNGEDRLIVYKLFVPHIYANLGSYAERVLKEYYPDATFANPRNAVLCNNTAGSLFEYTADLNHDGHRFDVTEMTAQGDALYAIDYVRPSGERVDPQASRILASLCPPNDEAPPEPTPAPLPSEFPAFTLPVGYEDTEGRTENSIEWQSTDARYAGSLVAVRHEPTLFTNVEAYGAEQARLARSKAPTLDGFERYSLQINRPQEICAAYPAGGWYTEIAGEYMGVPAVAKQIFYVSAGTLYSAAYLRPLAVPEDPAALASLRSICPRDGIGSLQLPNVGFAAAYRFADFSSLFDVAYAVRMGSGSGSNSSVFLSVGGDDGTSTAFSIGVRGRSAFAQMLQPSRAPQLTPVATTCAPGCVLELRGSDIIVEALVDGNRVASWPRGRYPALLTRLSIAGVAFTNGAGLHASAQPVRATARSLPIVPPRCGIDAQGIAARVRPDGNVTVEGKRRSGVRAAYVDLERGSPVINCASAMVEARQSGGTMAAKPSFVFDGTPLTAEQIRALLVTSFGGSARNGKTEWKSAAAMPDYAPYITYAGKDTSGVPIFWAARGGETDPRSVSDAERAERTREAQAAAVAAAVVDSPQLRPLATQGGDSPEALMLLGYQLGDLFRQNSENDVAHSAAVTRWALQYVEPGMSRANFDQLLSANGLTATHGGNACRNDFAVRWRDEGTYPFSLCLSTPEASSRAAFINLPGPSQPGCSFSSDLIVLFDAKNRVARLVLGNPTPDCL